MRARSLAWPVTLHENGIAHQYAVLAPTRGKGWRIVRLAHARPPEPEWRALIVDEGRRAMLSMAGEWHIGDIAEATSLRGSQNAARRPDR
jgi:hypothetical protein